MSHVDLYARYPDFHIDIRREQEQLAGADLIIFQHPFFWYSSPAILKEWQDVVLEHGFAYGEGGNALRGKALLSVISTGGVREAYCPAGHNHFTMAEFLRPFEQTARLCGMHYLPPFVVHGTHSLQKDEVDAQAVELRRCVERLADESCDLGRLEGATLTEVIP